MEASGRCRRPCVPDSGMTRCGDCSVSDWANDGHTASNERNLVSITNNSTGNKVANTGQVLRTVAAKLDRARSHSLEQLPRRSVVKAGVVHRVVSWVHPGADGDVLRDSGEVPEITLHVIISGWRYNVVVVSTGTTGEDAVSSGVYGKRGSVIGVWVVNIGLTDFRWVGGQVYIASLGEGVQ